VGGRVGKDIMSEKAPWISDGRWGGGGWKRHHGSLMGGGLGKTYESLSVGEGVGKTSWVSDGSVFKAFGKNESATYCFKRC